MKSKLREIYKTRRREMSLEDVALKSRDACKLFLESDLYKNAKAIMLYMPLGKETDTSEIIKKSFADGKKVAFPVTDEKSGEITPCYATAETEFTKGGFSVKEPCGNDIANPTDFDVVIVPGIAFDTMGNRIGFGKGCYDKLLCKTNAVRVGFCYELQICDEIPAEEFDIKMDCIITETGIKTH